MAISLTADAGIMSRPVYCSNTVVFFQVNAWKPLMCCRVSWRPGSGWSFCWTLSPLWSRTCLWSTAALTLAWSRTGTRYRAVHQLQLSNITLYPLKARIDSFLRGYFMYLFSLCRSSLVTALWQAEAGSMAGWFMCSVRYGCTARVPQWDTAQQFHLNNILSIVPLLSLIGLYSIWWQSVWSSCTEDLQGKQNWDTEVCACLCLLMCGEKAPHTGSVILDLLKHLFECTTFKHTMLRLWTRPWQLELRSSDWTTLVGLGSRKESSLWLVTQIYSWYVHFVKHLCMSLLMDWICAI